MYNLLITSDHFPQYVLYLKNRARNLKDSIIELCLDFYET